MSKDISEVGTPPRADSGMPTRLPANQTVSQFEKNVIPDERREA